MPHKGAILVTRPAGQAGELVALLNDRGYPAYGQPLLELEGLVALSFEAKQYLAVLHLYRHIIFVSGNAVDFGMKYITEQAETFAGSSNIYAIGDTTAAKLAQHGIHAASAGPKMTSEGLLENDQLQTLAGQRVLIVKGEGGRQKLRTILMQRGAEVDQLSCYKRKCPALVAGELAEKIRQWDIRTIMLSSGEGLCNLLTLLSPSETIKLSRLLLIVPSDRVARLAREAGFLLVKVANNASNAAMLDRFEQCSLTAEKIGER
ncbi:MAG: uroporphyrinogen-III synthase [Halioglobus sp.]|jgi:uroporphyrinogen-III synthase